MHDILDIYIKFQIAVITMLVPMLIFYINHASDAKKAKDEVYDKNIKELQKNSQLDGSDTEKFTSDVSDLHNKIALLKAQRIEDMRLLNPLRQMKRIYLCLISSFVIIIFDIIVKNNIFNLYNHNLSIFLISLSLILFFIATFFIAKVAIVGVKSKEDIENITKK